MSSKVFEVLVRQNSSSSSCLHTNTCFGGKKNAMMNHTKCAQNECHYSHSLISLFKFNQTFRDCFYDVSFKVFKVLGQNSSHSNDSSTSCVHTTCFGGQKNAMMNHTKCAQNECHYSHRSQFREFPSRSCSSNGALMEEKKLTKEDWR